jgi:hypothetical protein
MKKFSYKGYRFPPEIIQQAIWLYLRFTLSLRDVEDLLAERGIAVSYEAIRRWVNYFGPKIAMDLRTRVLDVLVQSRRNKQAALKLMRKLLKSRARRLVMGQVAVAEKSNEIVAIPALLDMMAIEGAVVTKDAMGCQRSFARKIIDKKADYILALKGNQGTLREDVGVFAPMVSRTRRSAGTKRSTAIMAASKREPIRRSTM